jgi:hypothetical protein
MPVPSPGAPPWREWLADRAPSVLLPAQEALLAVSLALRRDPARARSAAFGKACVEWMQASESRFPIAPQTSPPQPAPIESGRAAITPSAQPQPQPVSGARPRSRPLRVEFDFAAPDAQPSLSDGQPPAHDIRVEPRGMDVPPASSSKDLDPAPAQRGRLVPFQPPVEQFADAVAAPAATHLLPPNLPVQTDQLSAGYVPHPNVPVHTDLPAAAPSPAELFVTATEFGGLLFALNAMLALGFYSDFSAPLGPNLEISPWDLLALVGERWQGDNFRSDPIWTLLAELAGHGDRPASLPPGDDLIGTLTEWLARALGVESAEAPAFLMRSPAKISRTHAHLDAYYSLQQHPIEIRCSGLDRDPGWIPAAGRYVAFHFD